MPFFKDNTTNEVVFYPRLYNNRYINGEIDAIEDFDKCVAIKDGEVVVEGYAEEIADVVHDTMFLKTDWYGTTPTNVTSEPAQPLIEEVFTSAPEPTVPEPILEVEEREAEGAISEVGTKELVFDRSIGRPRASTKEFSLVKSDPIHT